MKRLITWKQTAMALDAALQLEAKQAARYHRDMNRFMHAFSEATRHYEKQLERVRELEELVADLKQRLSMAETLAQVRGDELDALK